MPSTVLYLVASLVAYQVYRYVSGLRRNIAKAKATGLPYYVVRKLTAKMRAKRTDMLMNSFFSHEPDEPAWPARRSFGTWFVEVASAQILGGYPTVSTRQSQWQPPIRDTSLLTRHM